MGIFKRLIYAIQNKPEPQLSSEQARRMGSVKSEAKARASRENGKKGGRPPKKKLKETPKDTANQLDLFK